VLAVVDPGVGTQRRPVAVQSGGQTFIGPDNGLLSWAVGGALARPETAPDTTGVVSPPVSGVMLDRPAFWLPLVSATFHGRDLFGPVAAHLANGVPLRDLGTVIALNTLTRLPFPSVEHTSDAAGRVRTLRGEVIHVDHYGNLITNVTGAILPPDPVVRLGAHQIVGLSAHYQSTTGSLVALVSSTGFLEVAAPNGSAALVTSAAVGTPVVVESGPASP
jgi:S-adenosylmethionine hydrolase